MTVNLNAVSVASALAVTPVAPLIEGSAAATLNIISHNSATSANFNFGSALTGRRGMRVNTPTALDLTGHDFITFAAGTTNYGIGLSLDTVANGGMRIYFADASGNYAGYNIYGSLPLYSPAGGVDGFMANYNANSFVFTIATARVPDIVSGSVDWAAITAIEVTAKTISNSSKDFHLSRIVKRSVPFVTGTETFQRCAEAVESVKTSTIGDPLLIKRAQLFLTAAAQLNYNLRIGLTVGNGSTTTNFTDRDFAVGFETTYEFSPAYPCIGPWVQLDANGTRKLKVNQSASDVLNLTDGSFSGAGWWQWELLGSGSATCTRVQFWRFNGFLAAHGTYNECVWDEGTVPVQVTDSTVISEGVIRNATTSALKILGAAGSYTTLGVRLNNPSALYDIELGSGGAGAYSLPNITVPSGYTLKLRNDSATNAITVAIPLGVSYSTSTAGGSISVTVPEVSADIEAAELISGSRVQLYNVTDGVEVLNTVLASDGLIHTELYTADKVIRLRADHATKLPLETAGVLTASGLTFLDVQVEDDVYLGNGIDGGTVTEFAPDGANVQVDIDDPDGITNVQRLYAWMQWYMTTEEGVASVFFGAMNAIDSANYVIDQAKADILLDNVSAMPVRVIGGYLYRKDGSTVIAAGSYSVQMDPGKAYPVEVGVSGLTPTESGKLDYVSLLALETTAQSILAKPDAPTANVVRDAVWADAKADTLALEATAQAALTAATESAADAASLLARPLPPTASEISADVWADPAVSDLATEVTAQAATDAATLAASRSAELLAQPSPPTVGEIWAAPTVGQLALEDTAQLALTAALTAAANTDTPPPTATEIADGVWAHPFVAKLLTIAKYMGLK